MHFQNMSRLDPSTWKVKLFVEYLDAGSYKSTHGAVNARFYVFTKRVLPQRDQPMSNGVLLEWHAAGTTYCTNTESKA